MALRAKRDPQNIFLNDYWSLHLFGQAKNPLPNASQKQADANQNGIMQVIS
jgi:hypothetical protein